MAASSGTMIKKSPYLFFLYFESMCYKYLPCQILTNAFEEKSDFLNYDTITRHNSIQKWPSSKERLGLREDVTSSNQDIKTNVNKYTEEECEVYVLFFAVCFCTLALEKIMPSSRCVVLTG